MLEGSWEALVDKDGKPAAPMDDANRRIILAEALSKALVTARKTGTVTKHVSLDTCEQLFSPVVRRTTSTPPEVSASSGKRARPADLCLDAARHHVNNLRAHDTSAAPNTTATQTPGFSFITEADRSPLKRALPHPLISLIPTLTPNSIAEGLRCNSAGGGKFKPQVTLFVWHVHAAGSIETLRTLLTTLRGDGLLTDVCVLLVDDIGPPHRSERAALNGIGDLGKARAAMKMVQQVLKVSVGPN